MPMIQLIRRDSTVIELEATDIQFSIQRTVLVHPIPLIATRAGLDLNQPQVCITINGIITLHTGQPYDKVEKDTERDFYLTAEESKNYGIVDEVMKNRDVKLK